MRAIPLALLLSVASVVTGCVRIEPVATGSDPGVGDAFAALRGTLGDLPCEATEVGSATSENLREVSNLAYDGSTHGEIDAKGNLLLVARYQSGGFEVVDVSDPANPRLVSNFTEFEPPGLDVKFTPDGLGAVVGNSGGIAVVDLSDPGTPRVASTWEYPNPATMSNMHMLYTKSIGGKDWLFLAPNDDTGVHILQFEGAPANRTLRAVATFGAPLSGGPLGPHDMTVLDDEISGKPILYVANGFEGWLAADVSDPASPKLLGGLPNLDPYQGYTHTIMAEKIGERRIVATIAEVGSNALKVYDATNLQAPVLLATWQADPARPLSPQHNLQLVDGLLYVAHYMHGVFVFNLTGLADAPLVGTLFLSPMAHYAPPEPGSPGPTGFAFGNVWDVVLLKGVLYVNDVGRGTAAVAFGCVVPGDEAATSFG